MDALEKYRQQQLRQEKENALAEKRREKRRREEAKAKAERLAKLEAEQAERRAARKAKREAEQAEALKKAQEEGEREAEEDKAQLVQTLNQRAKANEELEQVCIPHTRMSSSTYFTRARARTHIQRSARRYSPLITCHSLVGRLQAHSLTRHSLAGPFTYASFACRALTY